MVIISSIVLGRDNDLYPIYVKNCACALNTYTLSIDDIVRTISSMH